MKELYNKILKDGGFSVNYDLEPMTKKKGYMVSLAGKEITLAKDDYEAFKDAILVTRGRLEGNDEFIGGWIDKGIIYIDVSKHIILREAAVQVAKENKQLGIYDIAKDETIYIK